MTSTITKLPTASSSYYTIGKRSGGWAVYLVTPSVGRPLKTMLAVFGAQEAAAEHAIDAGNRTHRPVKLPKIGGAA